MRILIADDSFIHRKVMMKLLSDYGECDVTVDGEEVVEAFDLAWDEKTPYDLVCLDITMPKMDGHEALRRIRQHEEEHGINGLDSTKVIMTTALDKSEDIFQAFRDGCEAYIVKPVTTQALVTEMGKLGLF